MSRLALSPKFIFEVMQRGSPEGKWYPPFSMTFVGTWQNPKFSGKEGLVCCIQVP